MTADRVTVRCPNCAARLNVPTAAGGRRVRCPKCNVPFVAQTQAPPPSTPSNGGLGEDLFAGLARGAAVEDPNARRAARDGLLAEDGAAADIAPAAAPPQEEDPGGQRRWDLTDWILDFGKAFSPAELGSRVRLVMVVMGVAVAGYGFKAVRLQSNYLPEPKVISCAELIAQGSADNAHVILTDFVLLPDYVYVQRLTTWQGAWIPAVPYQQIHEAVARTLSIDPTQVPDLPDEQWKRALRNLKSSDFDIRLVISFPAADGKDYVERLYEVETLECTVVSDYGIGRLRSEDRKLLEGAYPRSNLSRCRVLQEGQATSLAKGRAHQVGGCALVLLALASAAWSASRQPG